MNQSSSGWQLVFFSFALVLILFETLRGWRLGVVRQLFRLLALGAAYASALFASRALVPVLRPFIRAPDLVISLLSGALLALIVYAVINALGAILFKRTAQQSAGLVRFFYGTLGAVLGIFFGFFSVWLIVVGIRSLGAIAGAESHVAGNPSGTSGAPAMSSIAQLKSSIERGSLGEAVKAVDPVPAQTYQTLGKLGTVASDPRTAERFLACPGAKELTENPKIISLRNDPEIMQLIEQQRFLELLQNPKLIEALNDPALAAQVRSFDFQKALDYALSNYARQPQGGN
jgi:uncharacterized membrane protein required for colicin V production